ncbi:MAG: ABC transporter permease subunit [Pseudomonadota bacterium]
MAPAAYLQHRTVRFSVGLLFVISVAAMVGPWISPHDYTATNFDALKLPPSWQHWFGTDDLGRDLFVRTMMGIRVTLIVAIVASVVSLVIGVLYGAIAGMLGGRVDAVMMRIVDALFALPYLFFVILLVVVFDNNIYLLFLAIGVVNWLDMARIVRGQTLSLREREYVDAARLAGVRLPGLVLRHIAPNLIGVVVVYITLSIPQIILMESFLSFLGLGIREPQTSLGALVDIGVRQIETASWILLIPASALALILLCFNFLGDGLRDVLDSRSRDT